MIKDQQPSVNERKFQEHVLNYSDKKMKKPDISIHSEEITFQSRIGFKNITCRLANGKLFTFEAAYVEKVQQFKVHGVSVIPILHYKDKKPQIMIIANYRPPVKNFCLQFPGGYVESQDYQQEAKRETLQEIGYEVKSFCDINMPVMYSDPWRSNQSIYMYIANIDGDDTNKNIGQNLEEDENIRLYKLPLDQNLMKNINSLSKKHDYIIEKNVWVVALGIIIKNFTK